MTNNQTDWRALCAELHYWAIELAASHPNLSESGIAKLNEITDHTSTALAQPEPEEKWYPRFADWLEQEMPEGTVIGDPLWWASKIADYLARWGRPAVEPEPEGPTDEEIEREAIANADTDDEYRAFKNGAFFVQEHMNRLALARWGK